MSNRWQALLASLIWASGVPGQDIYQPWLIYKFVDKRISNMINFAENFWGDKNNGYDVLYHNMKLGHVACQDLIEYLKESARVEESYNKSLGKLAAKVRRFVLS